MRLNSLDSKGILEWRKPSALPQQSADVQGPYLTASPEKSKARSPKNRQVALHLCHPHSLQMGGRNSQGLSQGTQALEMLSSWQTCHLGLHSSVFPRYLASSSGRVGAFLGIINCYV